MKHRISEEMVGIKDHHEQEMKTAETSDCKYLGGMDSAEYSLKQEDKLAQNVRKHRAD